MDEKYVHATKLQIKKDEFLQRVDPLIREVDSLRSLHYEHSNFRIWQGRVKALLIHAFGERTQQVHDFEEIVFFNAWSDDSMNTQTEEFSWGLQRASEQLLLIKDEVVEYFPNTIEGESADNYAYDVFVSHANDNKQSFVDSLFDGLGRLRINIWYDSSEIDWGDNLKDKIMEGLEKCRFGIVVLSPEFIGRKWTEKELLELLNRQNERHEKVVLPLLYNLTVEQMVAKYPALSSIKARVITADEDASDVVIDFARIMIKALRCK